MADEQTVDTQNLDANQGPEASGEDLAARVQVLEEQLAGAQDQALRVAADLQNVRRRAEQDVEKGSQIRPGKVRWRSAADHRQPGARSGAIQP